MKIYKGDKMDTTTWSNVVSAKIIYDPLGDTHYHEYGTVLHPNYEYHNSYIYIIKNGE